MYEKIDLEELGKVLEASVARGPENIRMENFWCGTAGCLLGTYTLRYDAKITLTDLNYTSADYDLFGLPFHQHRFLFYYHNSDTTPAATSLTGEQAIARLRKVIRYKTRKRELWREHEWWKSLPKVERRRIPEESIAMCKGE